MLAVIDIRAAFDLAHYAAAGTMVLEWGRERGVIEFYVIKKSI